MSAVLFDTLRRSRTLREKGHFTAERAEALAEALGDTAQDNLATTAGISALKADARETELRLEAKIDAVKSSLELKIEAVRSSLEFKIDAVKAGLLIWVASAIGFQTLAITGTAIALARIYGK